MNKFIIYLLILSIVSCVPTPRKVAEDDACIIFTLKREFVKDTADRPPTFLAKAFNDDNNDNSGFVVPNFDAGSGRDFLAAVVILTVVFVAAAGVERGIKNLGGTDVFVCPIGYSDYWQEIGWGSNKVYIPSELRNKKFYLLVEMKGSHTGRTSVCIDPIKNEARIEK